MASLPGGTLAPPASNPVDVVEGLAARREWPYSRNGDDDIIVEHSGHWCAYRMFVSLHPVEEVLLFALFFDARVGDSKMEAVCRLLALINARLLVGHFDMGIEDGYPVFRHTELLGGGGAVGARRIEQIFEIALTECERYYPAFQLVVWAGKTPEEALRASILETSGQA